MSISDWSSDGCSSDSCVNGRDHSQHSQDDRPGKSLEVRRHDDLEQRGLGSLRVRGNVFEQCPGIVNQLARLVEFYRMIEPRLPAGVQRLCIALQGLLQGLYMFGGIQYTVGRLFGHARYVMQTEIGRASCRERVCQYV